MRTILRIPAPFAHQKNSNLRISPPPGKFDKIGPKSYTNPMKNKHDITPPHTISLHPSQPGMARIKKSTRRTDRNRKIRYKSKGWPPERRAAAAVRIRMHRPWRHSTGPRTASGKARSAQNALKHGVRSAAGRDLMQLLNLQRIFRIYVDRCLRQGLPVQLTAAEKISIARLPVAIARAADKFLLCDNSRKNITDMPAPCGEGHGTKCRSHER